MKNIFIILMLVVFLLPSTTFAIYDPNEQASTGDGAAPMILRATEAAPTLMDINHTQATKYFDPVSKESVDINGAYDAFAVMQKYGLGINQKSYDEFIKNTPEKLDGRIVLNVEDSGKAYIIDIKNNKLIYLGKPDSALLEFSKYSFGDEMALETYKIGSQLVDCAGVGPMKCMVINDKYFYDNIEGFEFESGYNYEIKVKKELRPEPVPADVSRYLYKLIEIVSKTADIPDNCESWFDGCNTCFVEGGELGGCTRKACAQKEESQCLLYSE